MPLVLSGMLQQTPDRTSRPEPLMARRRVLSKELFDRFAAACGLLLLSPLLLLIAALIKLDSRGPVLFRQQRVGRDFRPFDMWKFRTMTQDAQALGGSLTVGDDPRVTRIGRALRRTKLDELPQLVNVFKGDMSLVGPRPEVRKYVDLFVSEYRELLQVRPGVTDLASIAYRDEASALGQAADPEGEYITRALPQKLRLSRESIERSSFWFDLGVIMATLVDVGLDRMLLGFTPGHARAKRFGSRLRVAVLRHRRFLVIVLQLGLAALANYVAFSLRFDGSIPAREYRLFVVTLPWLLVIRSVAFSLFRVNEGLWRYTSIWDLRCIFIAVTTSAVAWYLLVRGVWGIRAYPRSIFIIDALLLMFLLGGVRLVRRILPAAMRARRGRRVLIVGAGDLGERIVRDMRWHADRYDPVAFVDDDGAKRGQYIHGVPVLGSWDELPSVVSATRPQEVLIATRVIGPAALRRLLMLLEPFPVAITTATSHDEPGGHLALAGIRGLALEDLLERAPIGLDAAALGVLLTGRRVLVTGAGGSIGSELCTQVAALNPSVLVLCERYENNLYAVVNTLNDRGLSAGIHPVVADVTDERRLDAIFALTRPEVVFHAAAHKHVPLMEANPCEAVKNNVTGTRIVAEVAARHGAERMILISSDKAVNPRSVMGATKRVAEIILSELSMSGATRFATVRFGNVLGSNGSVVPRFVEQIRAGGPVTITHPEVRRYFMLISEAVELVLHAASLAEPGSVYVLDMGEQIRLVDLARSVIRLSGLVADRDVELVFTGLRPGEKLSEELVGIEEQSVASPVPKIRQIQRRTRVAKSRVAVDLARLEQFAMRGDEAAVIEQLRVIVPTFTPSDTRRPALSWQHGPAAPDPAMIPLPATVYPNGLAQHGANRH